MTARLERVALHGSDEPGGISFRCPGCGLMHHLYTQDVPARVVGPRWHFNGDFERPVLSPSILSHGGFAADGDTWDDKAICHSFIGCNGAQPGQIVFLGDCTHALVGTTVDLPEVRDAAA